MKFKFIAAIVAAAFCAPAAIQAQEPQESPVADEIIIVASLLGEDPLAAPGEMAPAQDAQDQRFAEGPGPRFGQRFGSGNGEGPQGAGFQGQGPKGRAAR